MKLGNRFSSLCCQKASCVAWDKLLLCPSVLTLPVPSSSSVSQECLGFVRLDVARGGLMWGTELPCAGRERLKILPKLKTPGSRRKARKIQWEKGFDWKSLVSLRESKSLKL